MPAMSPKKGTNYPLPALLCLMLCHCSLPLILAKTCPKQCYCVEDKIDCPSPSFPIVLPARKVSDLVISGNFHTLPKNAVVQPEACNLTKVLIHLSTIYDIKPFSLSGLKASTVQLFTLKIVKLQPKAFANITCKIFYITYSTINVLQMNSFYGLNSEELIIFSSSFQLVSLKPSHLITIDSIKISKCHICKLDMHSPIGNQSVTISNNQIQSFYQDATVGVLFYENQIFCSCNLTLGWFSNEIYKNYLFNNTCLGPSHLEKLPLVNLNQSEICNQSQNLSVQCDVDIILQNSASEFFKFNQALVFFLVFVLSSSTYHL